MTELVNIEGSRRPLYSESGHFKVPFPVSIRTWKTVRYEATASMWNIERALVSCLLEKQ